MTGASPSPAGLPSLVSALDRHLDGDRADVGAAEAVDAERVDGVGVLAGARQQREVAAQVQRVEHRAEVDVEGLGALAGEDADAGRGVV